MERSVRDVGEFSLIHRLTADLASTPDMLQGVGDDCAVLSLGDRALLLTCDASLEDVHFKRDWGAPGDIGWKAAVSALSDIAAMGGRPRAVLVTMALPADLLESYVQQLYAGLVDAVESHGAVVAGGDTTASRSGIVIDISVVGEVVGRSVLRSGARPGDVVAMTGSIGERGAGLDALLRGERTSDFIPAYLHPRARIDEGLWLQEQAGVHAMMDVSDGLLPDSGHIAQRSSVGIELAGSKLPGNPALDAYWRALGLDSCLERLRSGEEYELLVAMGPTEAPEIMESFMARFDVPLSAVGFCNDQSGVVTVDGVEPGDGGFVHFRGAEEDS